MSNIKFIFIGMRSTKAKLADYLTDKKNSVFLDDYYKTTSEFIGKFSTEPNLHMTDSNVHGSWFYFLDDNLILYSGKFN